MPVAVLCRLKVTVPVGAVPEDPVLTVSAGEKATSLSVTSTPVLALYVR